MDIELNFINQSNDQNNSQVVIFQKNVAANVDETAIAWTVISNCGPGWSHKFRYPMATYVGASDSWGNVSDLHEAEHGQRWLVVRAASGDQLSLDGTGASSDAEFEIANMLPAGAIDALVYKDGRVIASKTGVSPQQKAAFQLKPTLFVGVVSQIEEGEVMNSAILSDMNTEFSLLGITKANLIMTGGGVGKDAVPFKFTLIPTA